MKAVDNFEDIVRELVNYDPSTGIFSWAKSGKKRVVGKTMGSRHPLGYVRLCVNQREYLAHRLAWWYFWGVSPEHDIDHINGNRADNRICNLRDIPHQINQQNRRSPNVGNTSGFLGVDFSKKINKFRARIKQEDGRVLNLGVFDDPAEAHAVYVEAKRKLHIGGTL